MLFLCWGHGRNRDPNHVIVAPTCCSSSFGHTPRTWKPFSMPGQVKRRTLRGLLATVAMAQLGPSVS